MLETTTWGHTIDHLAKSTPSSDAYWSLKWIIEDIVNMRTYMPSRSRRSQGWCRRSREGWKGGTGSVELLFFGWGVPPCCGNRFSFHVKARAPTVASSSHPINCLPLSHKPYLKSTTTEKPQRYVLYPYIEGFKCRPGAHRVGYVNMHTLVPPTAPICTHRKNVNRYWGKQALNKDTFSSAPTFPRMRNEQFKWDDCQFKIVS